MSSSDIEMAVEHLKRGLTVVFPTETVYGLGADASNPEAVDRIFALKGRPKNRPLIVHVESASRLGEWAEDIPRTAWTLAERFWPGPLTLVLFRRKEVPLEVTGGRETVGIRVPDHPVATSLLRNFGRGIAAPSANRFGRLSPTSSWHVRAVFGDDAGPILEGGPCTYGVESTIVGFVGEAPVLLRPGALSSPILEEFLGVRLLRPDPAREDIALPGSGDGHYQPKTPLEVLPAEKLRSRLLGQVFRGDRMGVLALSSLRELGAEKGDASFQMPGKSSDYARELYAALHFLDQGGVDRILIEAPPDDDAWCAVNDRLKRACHQPPGG